MKAKILGISLLELMLSLTIIAIILVAAMRYYTVTHESQQVNEAAEMVTAVYEAGASWIQFNNDFTDASIDAFVKNASLPANFTDPNANPWGGAVTAVQGKQPTTLAIALTNIPTTACNDLAAKIQAKMPKATANCSLIGIKSGLPTMTATFEFAQ